MLSCVANPQVTSCVWFNCLCNLFPCTCSRVGKCLAFLKCIVSSADWAVSTCFPRWAQVCSLSHTNTHTHTHTHTVSLAVRHGHSWSKACVGIEEHPAYICLSLWPIKPLLFLSLPPFTHGKVSKRYTTMLHPTLVIIIFHGNRICMFSSILKKSHVADENHDLLVTV